MQGEEQLNFFPQFLIFSHQEHKIGEQGGGALFSLLGLWFFFLSALNFPIPLFLLTPLADTDGVATEGNEENWISVAFPKLVAPWKVTESGKWGMVGTCE